MLSLIFIALILFPAFSISVVGKDKLSIRDDLFNSDEELSAFDFTMSAPKSKSSYYDDVEIYLLTGGPGSIVWENFGHSSYLVKRPDGESVTYDYGIFSFDDSFFINFALGKLYYQAWKSWAEYRVESFIMDDRDVSLLKLELDRDQKYSLISFLEYNARPENSTYLYDYYYDNCATRLRDSYNAATGGDFKAWAEKIEVDETLRTLSERYLSRSTFPVDFAITFLLGPDVDKKITLWDAMFLPEILEDGIMEYQGNESTSHYESVTRKDTPSAYSFLPRTILFAFILSIFIVLSHSDKKAINKLGHALSFLIFGLLSLMELVLAFFMTASIHSITYFNINVLIFIPALPLSALHLAALFGKENEDKIRRIARISVLALGAMMILKFILSSILIQRTLPYFAFMIILTSAELVKARANSERKEL